MKCESAENYKKFHCYKTQLQQHLSNTQNTRPQFRLQAATRLHKAGIASNHWSIGEFVLGPYKNLKECKIDLYVITTWAHLEVKEQQNLKTDPTDSTSELMRRH